MWPCVMQTMSLVSAKYGAPADVEADVQLRHLHDRFLAGHAVADDVELPEAELGELLDKEGLFDCGGFHPAAKRLRARVRADKHR